MSNAQKISKIKMRLLTQTGDVECFNPIKTLSIFLTHQNRRLMAIKSSSPAVLMAAAASPTSQTANQDSKIQVNRTLSSQMTLQSKYRQRIALNHMM